jgi:SpoIID/LytB domain protein
MVKFKEEPTISVGILSEDKIDFELYGDFKSVGFNKVFSGRFSAEYSDSKIICTYGDETLQVSDMIEFEPTDPGDSFLVRNVTIGVKFHWERKQNQRFLGILKLIKDEDKITLINILPIETYLMSVISSEMSARSSINLLKAHAIVSRSWVLAQITKSKEQKADKPEKKDFVETEDELIRWYDRQDHELYDVCADDHCQRYQGITKIQTGVVKKAIDETRGIVLIFADNICDTRYSKSCGGISESYEKIWENKKHPYLTSIIDYKYEPENYNLDFSMEKNAERWIKENPPAFCNTNDMRILSQVLLDYDRETTDFFRWKIEHTQKEISELIKKNLGIDFGDILDLIPLERGHSARIVRLKITGSKKQMIIGKELEIRRTLSNTHLYSSAIFIEKSEIKAGIPQRFIIYGAGWGHGAGLCQIGAAVMAGKGYMFDEILSHYFKSAGLKKIY